MLDTSDQEPEPLYGKTYLPRKFKIGIAVPPSNDIDVFSQDIGLISIIEDGELVGFNLTVGGGMGMKHGNTATYPQVGRLIGYFPKSQVIDVCEKILTIQRDHGNREERTNARFKYTVDRKGVTWITDELNRRLGWELEPKRAFHFEDNGDRYGWTEGSGKHHFTLFIQNGRVKDTENIN